MGYYIRTNGNHDKAEELMQLYPETEGPRIPPDFTSISQDKAVVCVVDNGVFEAAGLCYDEEEFNAFNQEDGRDRKWLIMDKGLAYNLAGYKK